MSLDKTTTLPNTDVQALCDIFKMNCSKESCGKIKNINERPLKKSLSLMEEPTPFDAMHS
jgi:hypothetical protein